MRGDVANGEGGISRKGFLGMLAESVVVGAMPRALAASRGMKTPLLLDVKRMAIHDGPGIRTTFFVKGCPLRCVWCHNPESIDPNPQTARFQHLCQHCAKCTMDEATCPTRALKFYGKPQTIEGLVKKALEDKAFYDRTGGGVTLSGGEPLFFWEWAYEFLSVCKEAGLHTCLDTSLYASPMALEKLFPVVDMWLPDFKCADDVVHRKCTGVSNGIIKRNLEWLVAEKANMEVRCLVVPGHTEDMSSRYAYLDSIGIDRANVVELEYFDYARSKYRALGMTDTMPAKS